MLMIVLYVSVPSIETEVRFLFIVSSCRRHFFPSKPFLLVTGPDCGVSLAASTVLLKEAFMDVCGGCTSSMRKISSSNKGGGFLICGLTRAIGDCFGFFELRLDIFRPHELGAGDP